MVKKRLSALRLAQLRRQARINFGLSRSTKRGVTRMARKRRVGRRSRGGSVKPMNVLIGGGIYGAVRAKISNVLAPLTSKIPLGTIADEATLFVISQQLNQRIRDRTFKAVTSAAMAVEAARIGEALLEGSAFMTAPTTNGGAAANAGFQTLG